MTMPVVWPGFHVLCIMPITQVEAQTALTRVAVFKRASRSAAPSTSFLVPKSAASSMGELANFFSHRLSIRPKKHPNYQYQRMGFFSRRGKRLQGSMDEIFGRPSVLIMEGGQWIWPGVRIGHIVSKASLRLISNLMAATAATKSEDPEDSGDDTDAE